jgi:thiol-disulfide isomerase/thioredoxin
MVKEVQNSADFRASINVPNLVVVDYYATWCGPCKAIAPFIEQLSRRYPEVVFLKVGEHNCQVTISPSFPSLSLCFIRVRM